MAEQRNLLLAIVLSILILLGYNILVEQPRIEKQKASQKETTQPVAETPGPEAGTGRVKTPGAQPTEQAGPDSAAPRLGVDVSGVTGGTVGRTRETALRQVPRIAIDTPRVAGSIALRGARIDDIVLKDYRVSIEPDSPRIELLQPIGSPRPYYAEFGWLGAKVKLPDRNTVWRASGARLTPETSVTLSWDNGEGLVFEQRFSIDRNYMVEVTQRVRNTGAEPVTLAPYGLILRTGTPKTLGYYILHEGPLGVFDGKLKELKYKDLEPGQAVRQDTQGGWFGITDKYWLVALIPDQQRRVQTSFNSGLRGKTKVYQADFLDETVEIPAGGSVERTSRLFVGAKEVRLLDRYESELGIARFDLAVDFGWFYFLTKPIFYMIDWFYRMLGNFGLAILALTILIKAAFFPLANKSYRAMSKMKALQPKMVELRERFKDDKQRMNQELMALYKREGVNPAAGCLPMLVQIPVFFALYKVLFVTIEMRHAPFYGWIQDLSAPDPLGLLTAFGLIDWSVPASLQVVNIGLWPCIMGVTMYLQQRLNPTPADPIQAKIFMFMPLIFTFILARFPAGLVIYWAWNNVLSIAQQWIIMKRHGTAKS